jgi:hypothetical protein
VDVHGGVQVLCCKRFQLCRDNLGGDEKEGGGGSLLVCNYNSSVLVRWRKVVPSSITAYS